MKTKTRKPIPRSTTTPGLLSHICLTPVVSWDQFMSSHVTPQIWKNKRGIWWNRFGDGNKKAAPLGAAVIATLNHITGVILHDLFFAGMG